MEYYVQILPTDTKSKQIAELVIKSEHIESFNIIFNSPDNSLSKVDKIENTFKIAVKIDDNTKEILSELFLWAKSKGTEIGAYRKTIIWIIGENSKLFRKIVLPKSFVVDYEENFAQNNEKSATATIEIRQKMDELEKIEIDYSDITVNAKKDILDEDESNQV